MEAGARLGHARDAQQRLAEAFDVRARLRLVQRAHQQHALGVEAQLLAADVARLLEDDDGGDGQQDGGAELRHHQQGAHRRSARRHRPALQQDRGGGPRQDQRRVKAGQAAHRQHTRQFRHQQPGAVEIAPVEPDAQRGHEGGHEHFQQDVPQHGGHQGQQHRFHQELADQQPARRAQRLAHRHLAHPQGRSGGRQIDEVDDGDAQHHGSHGQQAVQYAQQVGGNAGGIGVDVG
ncbi:hypothetical protein AZA_66835 [Nitrospirillum viridazoti Y2]|nr:hypothetical protein AZA_66835 [Nitrospirillum amazonense Y2]